MEKTKKENVLIKLSHPHGEMEISLDEWERRGPGPRWLLRPYAAKNSVTGCRLPLSVIPLKYRNNTVSRFLIRIGLLKNPWKNSDC